MSTKQAVIISLMFVLMVMMLVCMGVWFQSSCELDAKLKAVDVLTDRKVALDRVVHGSAAEPGGLQALVDDPVNGLRAQFRAATERARQMDGDPQSGGMKQRLAFYEDKAPEIEKKWKVDAQSHWKNTFEEWLKLNGDITAAAERANKVAAESEDKLATAQSDLDQALADENTERSKMVVERKKMADDAGQIRVSQEEVNEKINAVTREVRKQRVVTPQGHVIQASPELLTAAIDLGSVQGVRNGMRFEIYSAAHAGQVRKGTLEVAKVGATSSQCIIVTKQPEEKMDPITGWVPANPAMKYSVYAAAGPDETDAQELQKPKSRADRVEALRLERIALEQGLEAAEKAKQEGEAPSKPPQELGRGFFPVMAGDWICNPDFTPIIPDAKFARQTREELIAMRDVNIGPLTFFITDAVRPYRRDYLKRLCERNGCKTTDSMSSDVNFIVSVPDMLNASALEDKLVAYKDKEDSAVSADVRAQRRILAALKSGQQLGAGVLAEDEMEAFFDRRQRKMELLRGKTIQPGQHTFVVAGQTRNRSAEQWARYIQDHGGVMAPELDSKVDYVVVGGGLDQAFLDKVKKLGLKIIREDEVPAFFGAK